MTIVSTRDFRSNQSRYLDMVSRGENVVLKSRKGHFKIVPVSDDDTITSKQGLVEELRAALAEVKESIEKGKNLQSLDNLIDELAD
ncbi:MAG: prevent-host-death family protein [Bacteroidales bacterium]|nr:prevent-host-death family protein [Bacteroidales bacterium]